MLLSRLLKLSLSSLVMAPGHGGCTGAVQSGDQQLVTRAGMAAFTVPPGWTAKAGTPGGPMILTVLAYHPVGRGGSVIVTHVAGDRRPVVGRFGMYPNTAFEEGLGVPARRFAIVGPLLANADGPLIIKVRLRQRPVIAPRKRA